MAQVSRQIGWSQESNLLYQILKQLNKLTSVLFGLKEAATPNYKVYTALLTQNGTSSTVNATSGLLIVGVSYLIDVYNAGDDFSNVGGPAAGLQGEWDGYSFVATGTTPNNWNNLSGLDYNEGAPVATVLENTIGNIWFTYNDAGIYDVFISDAFFTQNKTYLTIELYSTNLDGQGTFRNSFYYNDNGVARINTQASSDGYTWAFTNNILNGTPIEIRVYN
jgi:hypothetical protein